MRVYRETWADEDRRLEMQAAPVRFDIGTHVECLMGGYVWQRGTVIAHYYREPQWPLDRWTPYQVELDDGLLIWAPEDIDECIRAV